MTRALAGAGAGTAIGLGLFALVKWQGGNLGAVGGQGGNVPIAPGTALVLVSLGSALALREFLGGNRAARTLSLGLTGLAILLSADVGIHGFAGRESWWEYWLLPSPIMVRGIPLGRVSPFAAVLFLLSGLALLAAPGSAPARLWVRVAGDFAAGVSAVVAGVLVLAYAADSPLFYSSGLIPVALLTAIGILGLDVGLLARGIGGLLLRQGPPAGGAGVPGRPGIAWRREIGFSAVVALVVLATGVVYLRIQLAGMRHTAFHELAAIGDLKAEAITTWRNERIEDARYLARVPVVARAMAAFFGMPGDPAAGQDLTGILVALQQSRPYAATVIFDGRGEPRLAAPAGFHPDAAMQRAAREALATRTIAFADLHDGEAGRPISLDVLAPVGDAERGTGAAPIGVIAIRVNAGAELFQMIGSWPIPSETAETLLVRREGDEVVFLNELRHRAGTALRLRFPVGDPDLPAAAAVRGETGVHEGIDYRGTRVLAAVRPVPGTPWSLVAKVDQQEIYAPLRRQTVTVALVVFALLVATGFWTETVWRRKVGRLLKQDLDAERRYRELAERFALITRYGSDLILMADETGRIAEANDRAVEVYGFSRGKLRTMTLADLRTPGARAQLAGDLARAEAAGGGLFESVHARKDGTTFPVEVNYRLVQIGGRTARLEFIRDITRRKRDEEERRRFETQLQQTQRLESLGVMAGGIAHDFNNLLTTILGRASLMLFGLRADSPFREGLQEIEKASDRAAGLCRQMLAYAGRGQVALEALNLTRVIEEMASLLSVSIPARITFRRKLDAAIPPIESDATQVRQVVMNLVVNAAEAIVDGPGAIDVSTGVVDCDEAYLRLDSAIVPPPAGRYVYLEVSDTGAGMDAATLARIFDPFFTTKAEGRGLGLPAVLGIVLNNRGSLKVRSEPGRGTTIRVLFPAMSDGPNPAGGTAG
jgi:PAS domain S-box-containing protein